MKKVLLMVAATLACSAAIAQADTDTASTTAPPAPPADSRFEAAKAHALQRIGDRLAALSAEQSCAQAAQDRASLRTCMPAHRTHGHQADHATLPAAPAMPPAPPAPGTSVPAPVTANH